MSAKSKSVFRNVDVKLVAILAAFYTIFDLVYIIKIAYFREIRSAKEEYTWFDIFFMNILIDWVVVVTFMTLIAISTKSLINRKVPWKYIITIHLVFSILIGIAIQIFATLVDIFSGHATFSDFNAQDSLTKFVSVLDLNFLIYSAMICIIYAYYYLQQTRAAEKKHAVLESQLLNTRMKMLTAQLRPHFLFNTLNCIATLTETSPKDAQNTIADLSEFLRRILYGENTNMITLAEELDTLDYYLNILNVRFSENLSIKKNIDYTLDTKQVPSLLLQPIIENSVKYGYSYDHPKLEIVLSIQRIKNCMRIRVENDGKPLELTNTGLDEGIGLSNTQERLTNLYGEDCKLVLRNKPGDHGVETIISIPIQPP